MASSALDYTVHQYGTDRELQSVGVWIVDPAAKYWIIYIHGGAWRDPRVTHKTFEPTITKILAATTKDDPDSNCDKIAAFASIDYRLSPHSNFPQDLTKTPPAERRDAVHPDHLDDIRACLAQLQHQHGFGENYVLIGHSAGATLGYQLLQVNDDSSGAVVVPPRCVVGLAGIYDLRGLVARFGPAYESFITAAFGADARGWDLASPARFEGGGGSGSGWKRWAGAAGGEEEGRQRNLAVLAWSPEDDLVDEPEIDGMARFLEREGARALVLKDLVGTHNVVWEDGGHICRIVLRVLKELDA